MLPGYGSVVAGNSGSPQFENGGGSIPLSGHGGAGGFSLPTGANTCCSQIACCCWISRWSVGIKIGFADAPAGLPISSAAMQLSVVKPAWTRCFLLVTFPSVVRHPVVEDGLV